MPRRKTGAEEGSVWRFHGIRRPGYTQVPDDYIDEVMAHLTGAEFKVLMYLTRRTLGFKRASDQISLNQLCGGIRRRDGTQLDYGTGLSRQAVLDALRRLIDLGMVTEQQTIRDDGAFEAKTYTLVFDDPDPLEQTDLPTRSTRATPLSTQLTPLSTRASRGSIKKTGGSAETTTSSNRQTVPSNHETARSYQATGTGPTNGRTPGHLVDPQDTVEDRTALQEREISKVSKATSTTELPQHASGDESTARRIYNPHILNLIDDLSVQFHDGDAIGSNRTRVLRIWSRSALDDATFVDIMYEARRRALKAVNIQHQAGEGSDNGLPNRMPYFFRVLQDLIDRELDEAEG